MDSRHRARDERLRLLKMIPVLKPCKLCGKEFDAADKPKKLEYCPECKAEHGDLCRVIAHSRKPEARAYMAKWKRAWKLTPEGRVKSRAQERRYLYSTKGAERTCAYVLAHPDLYKRPWEYWSNRAVLLYIERRPCSECGETELAKLQADHVIPRSICRALGIWDCDMMWNLRVLCDKCHLERTDKRAIGVFKNVPEMWLLWSYGA